LAMVTPSLQTTGVPHFFSLSTAFDRGPQCDANGISELGSAAQYLFPRG